jgi:hypothetical protein
MMMCVQPENKNMEELLMGEAAHLYLCTSLLRTAANPGFYFDDKPAREDKAK